RFSTRCAPLLALAYSKGYIQPIQAAPGIGMAAKDLYHEDVRTALLRDGWTITDDPLRLRWGKKDYYVDLEAERVIAAERSGRRIAVEIKSFIGPSLVDDMEKALGQYLVYRSIMRHRQPDREL